MNFLEEYMDAFIAEYLGTLTGPFIDPQKRIFGGYLFASLLIAFGVQVVLNKIAFRRVISNLFSRRVWLSASALADYKILFINHALMLLIMPRLISKLALATLLFESLHVLFDGRPVLLPNVPGWTIAGLFTFCLFLFDDMAKYLVHRVLHRWPLLWNFHKVHHSAETLTPLTVYRTHPVEGVIFGLRSVCVQALTLAGFVFFFGDRAELVTVLGANIFLFMFNMVGSNLRHSHVWISYGRLLEHILISPAQHQIHHSIARQHHDKNFGAVLAIWDWFGGSLCLAKKGSLVHFGVDNSVPSYDLKTLYVTPFQEAAYQILQPIKKENFRMPSLFFLRAWRRSIIGGLTLTVVLTGFSVPVWSNELNIYSHRQPFLIKPFLKAYMKKSGTEINIVYASKGLAQRLQAEGRRSPADIILTVDIARLYVYADKKLLASVDSSILKTNIPSHLRDPNNRWFALSKRARVIAVANRAADTLGIRRYEDLTDPRWKGRICARPGSHVYNRALIASLINSGTTESAEAWAKGLVNNLARRPQGNDRAQIKAIYEGVCDIAIINNYYFGKLKHSGKSAQRAWAASVKLIFPNQSDRGTHINISGGGVAKHSKNKVEAVKFLEFLTSKVAQNLYGSINFEYPVNPKVPASKELAAWGSFDEDKMPIARIAELASEAQKVIDRVGW
jgi:iron(III) transport system substrate-binding protein